MRGSVEGVLGEREYAGVGEVLSEREYYITWVCRM